MASRSVNNYVSSHSACARNWATSRLKQSFCRTRSRNRNLVTCPPFQPTFLSSSRQLSITPPLPALQPALLLLPRLQILSRLYQTRTLFPNFLTRLRLLCLMSLELFPRWHRELPLLPERLVVLVCPRPTTVLLPSLDLNLLPRRPVRLVAVSRLVAQRQCARQPTVPLGLARLLTNFPPLTRSPIFELLPLRCNASRLVCTPRDLSFPGRLVLHLAPHLERRFIALPMCLRRLRSVLVSALVALPHLQLQATT